MLPGPSYRTVWSTSCVEAWRLLHENPIDVVITEASLCDGLDWRDLVGEVAGMTEAPQVILMSRTVDDRLWLQGLEAGAFDILRKPLDSTELVRAVHSAWRRSRDLRLVREACGAGQRP
jgi:DNA-binding response OmpR family regulator